MPLSVIRVAEETSRYSRDGQRQVNWSTIIMHNNNVLELLCHVKFSKSIENEAISGSCSEPRGVESSQKRL